jgi:hypothetical protein
VLGPATFPFFSLKEVERALLELETNKGAGPDGISLIILKNYATAFALPLCLIFNNTNQLVFFLTSGNFRT